MQEIQVYLPENVTENSSRADFQPPVVIGRCGHGCENMDSFALARKRLGDPYLSEDDKGILVLNLASAVHVIKWVLYDMAAFKAYTNEVGHWEV